MDLCGDSFLYCGYKTVTKTTKFSSFCLQWDAGVPDILAPNFWTPLPSPLQPLPALRRQHLMGPP